MQIVKAQKKKIKLLRQAEVTRTPSTYTLPGI